MCLLCVFEPDATPTRKQLENAAVNNPHGFGYSFLMEDRIITGRGMDAKDVIDRFMHLREGFPSVWAMFHARYATHGTTNKANCHPFRVGGDPNTVIAHNGILPIDVPKGEKRSDTRIFADEELPHVLEWLDDPNGWQMLEQFASGSKIAVFTLDSRLKDNIYIINEHLGHWDKGCWWSNDGYKRSYTYGSLLDSDYQNESCIIGGSSMTEWWKRSSQQTCIYCNTACSDQEWEWGYCDSCKSCLECASDIIDCECYRPESMYGNMDRSSSRRKALWWEDAENVQRSLVPYRSEGW